jgi:transposase-like protein
MVECAGCGRQTSLRVGTLMENSNLPLKTWFTGLYLVATHSNGISAKQLQRQLGLGSYKSAWLMLAKIRTAMSAGVTPLSGLVEVDETALPQRRKDDPPSGGQGRSHQGKMAVAGAVEICENEEGDRFMGRLRLAVIEDYTKETLHGFVVANIDPKSTLKSDGLPSYSGAPVAHHRRHVIGSMAAHVLMPDIHTVFANLKRWALGVYHGLRRKFLQSYLDEFVFRFNRRHAPFGAYRTLLKRTALTKPPTYKMLMEHA